MFIVSHRKEEGSMNVHVLAVSVYLSETSLASIIQP